MKAEPRVRRLWDDERIDDFVWLEDPDDPDVLEWLRAENERVAEVLGEQAATRAAIYDEIKRRVLETDLSVPVRKDEWEYYGRTEEGRQYGIHCRRLAPSEPGGEAGPEIVILDENLLVGESDYFDLGVFDVSTDHRLCLYGTDTDGDEKYELFCLDIESGVAERLGIEGVSAGSAWDNASTSFFYIRPDETNRPAEIWHHVLGSDPASDRCVYAEPDAQFFCGLGKERDDSFIHIGLGSAVTDETLLIPADRPDADPVVVETRDFGVEYSLGHRRRDDGGGDFYLHTNRDAPNFKLLKADASAVLADGPTDWEVAVPEREGTTLAGFDVFADHLVLVERVDGLLRISVRRFSDGEEHVIEQPEVVSTVRPGANPEADTSEFRYVYASMVTPPTVLSYDLDTRQRTVLKRTPVLDGFDSSTYDTDRIWATAEDGARIPILLVWKADRGGGPHPAVLYGYGSYEACLDPGFSISRLSLLDRGFTFAVAQVRGGGELGRSWYESAKYEHKERSFTDFVACARELVDRQLTTPAQLGIRGGSAGGLLVGAALNLAPELFGAVVAEVPFVDVINTMIDSTQQLTQIEWDEWGNPLEDRAIYEAMRAYTPYENVADATYPPMFVTGGLNDPRVRFWEPAKWVLELRRHNTGSNPILLKTELGAGHFGSTGRYDAWRDEAEILAFFVHALGGTASSQS